MLIIFDLDDTLIQTTDGIIPDKIKVGAREVGEVDLDQLLRMDQMALSSRAAMCEFSEINDLGDGVLDPIRTELRSTLFGKEPIATMTHMEETLSALAEDHHLCVVTRGDQAVQLDKLSRLGLVEDLFSEVVICSGKKGGYYEELAQKFDLTPDQVIVCGDRVGLDLAPAKALGYHTVQMVQGRGRVSCDYFADADYKIIQLVDLFDIIGDVERKNFLRSL